jgi:tetratricopeptide (TPR) repeat protein
LPTATSSRRVSPQHQLSDYLQAELLHTLGAYQLACAKLEELSDGVGSPRADTTPREVIETARKCNEHLREALHHPGTAGVDGSEHRRHPSPYDKPPAPPSPDLLLRVSDFYNTAATALGLYLESGPKRPRWRAKTDGQRLGQLIAVIHDPQRCGPVSADQQENLIRGRLGRMLHRLDYVNGLLPDPLRPPRPGSTAPRGAHDVRQDDARSFREILEDHTGMRAPFAAMHLTVLESLSDAHMWMHHAEHLRAQGFGTMFTQIPETHAAMKQALRRSVALNTFVYVAGRTMPWIFAENEEERDYVLDDYESCCETLTPTYCMWIGNQLSLLALQRRAYTWWTLGDRDRAYRDFHKLIRLLRDLRQRVDRRAVRVPGTKTLIEGLTAIAEHHIGRIYRGQHAHGIALRYFDRASWHLKGWEKHEEIGDILKNSRWRLNLLISQGKASYELGQVKKSLLYYARAWRAFLLLAESESHSTANVEVVTEVISWLAQVQDRPELSKTELSERLEPLIEQFETVHSPVHLRLLAADIMMRLGHLLFILKLPPVGWVLPADPAKLPPAPDHALAHRCLLQAAALDPASTLIAADLLKIHHGARKRWKGRPRKDPEMATLTSQWPAGSGRFEQAARVIEYILQRWLAMAPTDDHEAAPGVQPPDRRAIARELLGSFLAHTDSSNVKLAQVYRYLMQEPREMERDMASSSPTIDVVCLRRYSSFFPFLPRPAAFRAPGGGYLVRVCEAGTRAERGRRTEPFGIAVDPGPDFLDNLYRCGFALADIHMIVLTHDHADHMASVDALLALMGIRMSLGDKTFDAKEKRCLAIVGNQSVVERYRFFNLKHPVMLDKEGEQAARKDAVRVMNFDDFYGISRSGKGRRDRVEEAEILLTPTSLRIEPVQTIDHDDATGHISQGFLLSMGRGKSRSSVLFTGDTGPVPPRLNGAGEDAAGHRHYPASGTKTLAQAAASADVVVAHLSSVALPELRKLAGLTAGRDGDVEPLAEFIELWRKAVTRAQENGVSEDEDEGSRETRFLLKQLQFGFRSIAREEKPPLSVSPLSPLGDIKEQPEKHLYLTGLLDLAEHMARNRPADRPPLLLIGELREELGTFRTRIASRVTEAVFRRSTSTTGAGSDAGRGTALTADIGLRVRLSRPRAVLRAGVDTETAGEQASLEPLVLCTTCDLDNDLIAMERFHPPSGIREVCVKGEHEGVFYNCLLHDPGRQAEQPWVESVERFDVFGD